MTGVKIWSIYAAECEVTLTFNLQIPVNPSDRMINFLHKQSLDLCLICLN